MAYDEFARMYGPPQGTFDADWVTRLVLQRRPRLGEQVAGRLVGHTWRHLWASPQLSCADLVGYLALDEPGLPVADLEAAVQAAVDFCDAYAVEPPRP